MARKKLSTGVHRGVLVKNCKGKTCRRDIRVLRNGQWRFLKTKGSKKKK